MEQKSEVMEYKCPCCGSELIFDQTSGQMGCNSCGNYFSVEDVEAYQDSILQDETETFTWDTDMGAQWSDQEQEEIQVFSCPACGGTLITDQQTVATFCPFCDNPAILPGRVSGGLRPDAVIPFKNSKQDAKDAFLEICKKKKLLPDDFAETNHIEKITGIYVPFWLYDCSAEEHARYSAIRTSTWSDHRYRYHRTDHFLLIRDGEAEYAKIPMDGSGKIADEITESIEPYDYSELRPFDTAYLSGFLADKYDIEAEAGKSRIYQRASESMDRYLMESCMYYSQVMPQFKNLSVNHSNAKYTLLPLWLLTTKYNGELYTFAMNGQTGKFTGTFPISKEKSLKWFAGVCAAVTAAATAILLMLG